MKPEWVTDEDIEWQEATRKAVEEFRVSVEDAMQRFEESRFTEAYLLYRNALNKLVHETQMSVQDINKFVQTETA